MGLGRKANKPEDTSATSTSGDESSCMPASGMAADLSNSALEVRRRSHKVAESTLPKPTCSGLVTRAHHHDAAQARTSLPCPARAPRRPRQPISPRRCRSRLSSLMSPTTAHSLGSAPRCRPPPHACIRARHCEGHRGAELTVTRTNSPPVPQVTSEGKSSSDDAPSSQDVGPSQHHDDDKSEEIVEEEEEVVADVAAEEEIAEEEEVVAQEPLESAPRKKKRGSSLHAAAASSTTETPPPTLLNAKQRKKKQIEVGSSESASDPSQVEPEAMDEDAEESEAPKDKKKKSRQKVPTPGLKPQTTQTGLIFTRASLALDSG